MQNFPVTSSHGNRERTNEIEIEIEISRSVNYGSSKASRTSTIGGKIARTSSRQASLAKSPRVSKPFRNLKILKQSHSHQSENSNIYICLHIEREL